MQFSERISSLANDILYYKDNFDTSELLRIPM